jgi:prevent-host-death family protein
MKQITAEKFKAHCLAVMDQVNATGEPVLITKRGRPVAKLVPVTPKRNLFGFMAEEFRIVGDIEGPVVSVEKWELMRK